MAKYKKNLIIMTKAFTKNLTTIKTKSENIKLKKQKIKNKKLMQYIKI